MIRSFVFLYFLFAISGCGADAGPRAGVSPMHEARTDVASTESKAFPAGGRSGRHGMIVFGVSGSEALLSHIPMFHAPHDVQAIFRASFSKLPDDSQLYTLDPEPLALNNLVTGAVTQLRGTLYRGNFEQGGTPLYQVDVHVSEIIDARVLMAAPNLPALEYRLYTHGSRHFLVHPITIAEDFDQVLEVSVSGAPAASGISLVFADRQNTVRDRLTLGETLTSTQGVTVTVNAVVSTLLGPDFATPL